MLDNTSIQNNLSEYQFPIGNRYANGGKIHIKPSHRGRLTELKKRTGKSEAELYKTGGPAVRKSAVLERDPSTIYMVNSPEDLKLADAITYDDAGNIIPLSKRDNFNINDIRYGLLPFLGLGTAGTLYRKNKKGRN
jgi:hypothetical protein